MSFLEKAGVVGIAANEPDFSVPNGVFPAVISDSKVDVFNGVTKWQVTYRLHPDVEIFGGRTVSEWFSLDPDLAEERKQFLVRRLASLNIAEEEQKTLEPADIIGTEVTITVRNKPSADGTRTFTNVVKVVVGASAPAPSRNALANF